MPAEETPQVPDTFLPVPAGESRPAFLVCKGSITVSETGEEKANCPVCVRFSREESEDVAQFLNEALEETWYFEFVAGTSFQSGVGGIDELLAADTEEKREEWEATFGPHRKPIYIVREITIENNDAGRTE